MIYPRLIKKIHGVTLIELMIVLVIAAVLVAGIYSLFMTQQRSYSVQDQVSGVQQDARVALDIMARDIRMAGFQIGCGSGTGFDGITVNGQNYAVEPTANGGANAPDQIAIVLATTQVAQVSTVTPVAGNVITLQSLSAGDLNDTTRSYVAFEGIKKIYQIAAGGVDVPNDRITLTATAPVHLNTFESGARVYRVEVVTYAISGNVLQRDGQPFVGDGVTTIAEDLQFAYQVSGDTNWYNASTAFPAGKSSADIKMVRINIIVRTAVPDTQDTSFFKPACEDRPREDTFTGCRRRVYTTIVKVRNL